jgi:hypothetical protein
MQTEDKQNNTDNYFTEDLPATHNPLIAALPVDTLSNIRDSLCTLRALNETTEFSLDENSVTGLHFLMTCIIKALDFEIDCR